MDNLRHLAELTAGCEQRFMRFDLDYEVPLRLPLCSPLQNPCQRLLHGYDNAVWACCMGVSQCGICMTMPKNCSIPDSWSGGSRVNVHLFAHSLSLLHPLRRRRWWCWTRRRPGRRRGRSWSRTPSRRRFRKTWQTCCPRRRPSRSPWSRPRRSRELCESQTARQLVSRPASNAQPRQQQHVQA